ncbi:MEDS domain-containing protein [Actinomadura rubrisoli]|uniref:STAS domain-containing protein n=1 Tax=Actinomadura rubrisoli TaxID=2530368 RepID=A0A4R5A4K3_9ACTN|nr:MEDS domain-containing protein [Actinomadura rubrisoli]TDD65990.1 STAS domain-containing protein [Actinomadura rubrisoli]
METLWSVRRPVRDLRPGDHAWLAYACEDEQRHVAGAFVRDGLLAREKVIYLAGSVPAVVPGVPPETPAGLLTVLPAGEAGGRRFDPPAVARTLAAEIARAERQGFRAIRVAADMTWALRGPGGLDPLLDFERHLERLVPPSTHITAVCQLDRRRCRRAELAALRAGHSVLAIPDPEFEDAVLRIVRTFRPPGLALTGELDASRHAVLDQALASVISCSGTGEVHLDLSGLGFIDLGAINLLADVAGRRAAPGRLVLDRVSPQLRAVMETVGWSMLPGLRLGEPPP